jgi:hypothetical protein
MRSNGPDGVAVSGPRSLTTVAGSVPTWFLLYSQRAESQEIATRCSCNYPRPCGRPQIPDGEAAGGSTIGRAGGAVLGTGSGSHVRARSDAAALHNRYLRPMEETP